MPRNVNNAAIALRLTFGFLNRCKLNDQLLWLDFDPHDVGSDEANRADRERAGRSLLARLQSLPLVDGKPDVSGIGDPTETAKQWAAELKMTPEEFLQRLLEHLGEKRTS